MSWRKRTAKQQARHDAATQRAQQEAQDRHRRLEAERIRREEDEARAAMSHPHAIFRYTWTCWELRDSYFAGEWIALYMAREYGGYCALN